MIHNLKFQISDFKFQDDATLQTFNTELSNMNVYGDLRYVHTGEFAAFASRNSETLLNRIYDLKLTVRGEMELAYMGEITTPSRCGRLDQG